MAFSSKKFCACIMHRHRSVKKISDFQNINVQTLLMYFFSLKRFLCCAQRLILFMLLKSYLLGRYKESIDNGEVK